MRLVNKALFCAESYCDMKCAWVNAQRTRLGALAVLGHPVSLLRGSAAAENLRELVTQTATGRCLGAGDKN